MSDVGVEVQSLIDRGWKVIRLEPGSKKPVEAGWPDHDNVAEDFRPGENVGVKFGPVSGGLVDIDLDYEEARKLIGRPAFGLNHLVEFGRSSQPPGARGHRLVVCPDGTGEHRPLGIRGKASEVMKGLGHKLTVLEVRGKHSSQTAFPPSVAKGDPLVWTVPGSEPPTMPWEELNRRVELLAICALAAVLYPDEDCEQYCDLLAAALVEAGASAAAAADMAAEVAGLVGDVDNAFRPILAAPGGGLRALLAVAGVPEVEGSVRRWLRQDVPPAEAGTAEPGTHSPAQLQRMLEGLDPRDFANYYDWLNLLFAAHHTTGGSAEGREMFVHWSARNPEFGPGKKNPTSGSLWADDVRGMWARAGKQGPREGDRTVATILQALAEHDREDIAAEFKGQRDEFDDDLPADAAVESPRVAGLKFTTADQVEMKALDPLWPGRIFKGKLTTIAGMPDVGKTNVICDICARVSRGAEWPDQSGEAPPGSAIILSAEDDPEDTLVPRLAAAGADLRKVTILNSMVRQKDGKERMLNLGEDLGRLTELARSIPDLRVLVIDPVNAYIGTSKDTDSFKDADVRAVLSPVKEWAERFGVAVIIVTHFRKGGQGRAIDQVMGSLAFTALSRSAWAVVEEFGEDGKPTGRKLLAKIKQNVTAPVDALAYTMVGVIVDPDKDIVAPRVEWGEIVKGSADALMGGTGDTKRPRARLLEAVQFLQDELADGPKAAKEINAKALELDISDKTLDRASKSLGMQRRQERFGWVWWLPGDE